ncbi:MULTISPECIES: hypothetical protein [unclassified Janthinobacterium]|uniref:hypothetical protein n=1 Tax=unclassified Janthinobacterium TaxID=2610881 RepID=UPI0012FCC1CE|nr:MULTISPECIES: hypothetical protein [unclassified Janthinobacterium]MEC5162984.1 hypothetical protein [Janthinobacterium sp. CG_S6]
MTRTLVLKINYKAGSRKKTAHCDKLRFARPERRIAGAENPTPSRRAQLNFPRGKYIGMLALKRAGGNATISPQIFALRRQIGI